MSKLNFNDIGDDEIRVVKFEGSCEPQRNRSRVWVYVILLVGTLAAIIIIVCFVRSCKREVVIEQESACYHAAPQDETFIVAEGNEELEQKEFLAQKAVWLSKVDASATGGFAELVDTAINDVPMRLYIPHNAEMSLHIGEVDKSDTTIVYVAQAADVRADNGKIVGAFVLKGEPVAKGLSKRGYCASIDGRVVVGVADNSPLFEEAVEKNGYFFRQYALVDNGRLVENEPKGKSVRRAICERKGEVFMVESGARESFHDFANALVDLGVDNAVYLVGSSAYGWAVDEKGERREFGDENIYAGRKKLLKNINYIVWRKK